MKKLLFLFLILFFFFSCGRGKAPISESSRIIPDSFAIGLNLYNKGRAVYHHSNNMDSMLLCNWLKVSSYVMGIKRR